MSEKFIKQIRDKAGHKIETTPNQRAMDFVEQNKSLFELYAGRYGIQIEPAPQGVDTFAYDLVNKKISVSNIFYKDGMTKEEELIANEKSAFAVRHEIEHMLEHLGMLNESEENNLHKIKGVDIWNEYLKRTEEDEAFDLTDNCIADIRENREVIDKTDGNVGVEQSCYNEDLFKIPEGQDILDMRDDPMHIQLPQAILYEKRSGKKCLVSDEVRDAMNRLINNPKEDIIDIITDPKVSQSNRLYLQDIFIMPEIEALKKKDIKNKQNKNQGQNQKGQGNKNKGQNQKGQPPQQGQGQKGQQDKNNQNQSNPNQGQNQKGQGNKNKGQTNSKGTPNGATTQVDGTENNPTELTQKEINEMFKDDYKKAKRNLIPDPSHEELKKAVEKYLKANPNLGENEQEKKERELREAEEKKAENLGVNVNDLRKYDGLSQDVALLKSSQEINGIIKSIVSERKREKQNPHYPVEEGEYLAEPTVAVISVKAGNLSPKVWETTDIKEKKDKMYSEIELTFVCDKSGSMQGEKIQELQKAIVLFMNSQKILQNEIKEAEKEGELLKSLKVSWEVYTFQATQQDFTPIQKMSDEFSEKDRINVCAAFNNAPGNSTQDANCLSSIYDGLKNDKEKIQKLKDGELKKVVLVLTDGETGQATEVKNYQKLLTDLGVAIIGIGITEDGESVKTTYNKAFVAEKATDLPDCLGNIIVEQFKDLLPQRE